MSSDEIFNGVLQALRRISRAMDLHSRDLIARYGVSGPQVAVLRVLGERGELSVKEVTAAVHLSQATVTGILDRLSKGGHIVRSRHGADKRRVMVSLTSRGREVLALEPPVFGGHFVEEFGKLADWEQSQVLSVLQRVVAMMEVGAHAGERPTRMEPRIPDDTSGRKTLIANDDVAGVSR